MLTPDLLDRFTTHLKEALQKALSFTVRSGRELVDPGDLVVGLLHEKGAIGSELLQKSGASPQRAEIAFRGTPHVSSTAAMPDLSAPVKRVIEKCVLIAHLHEHRYVGTEHLLSAVLEVSSPEVNQFLESSGIDIDVLRDQVTQILKSTSHFPELALQQNGEEHQGRPRENVTQTASPRAAQRMSALETFTHELTHPKTADTLDPVIGRERELDRAIEILCRRTKNNPILLGEPGVGKTAIVEGLAKRLASGDIPDALHGKRLLSLDLALTVAGTMYRGEFEARIKQIIDEIKNDQDVILFIDEIHTIVGAGSTTGSLDAANMLKPALARGEIRCIGATTWSEFKKHIEPDAALERRFQPISISEPSVDETLEILRGVQEQYAKYHHITYAPETVASCVHLADRYITDRFFPDKAVDLLDESAACVNARQRSTERMERLSALELAINAAHETKEQAVMEGKLDAAEHSAKNAEKLKDDYTKLKTAYEKAREKDLPTVTPQDVAEVVARIANIDIRSVLATERERLSTLSDKLRSHIFGQHEAVDAVSDLIYRSRLGLGDPKRPRTAVLFVGPSGTGKTETARLIARELFGREDALIKLDMSEFAEGHTVSKLVGSPAGYVGYRDSTKLIDALRKRPHSVVLFDEFEKAHGDVQSLLLQILEDGTISDGSGRPVSFRHAYIVLTSNVGSDKLGMTSLGFGREQRDYHHTIKDELGQRFRPELLNRLDRIVYFKPLERDSLKQILDREMTQVMQRIESVQRVACKSGDDVLEWLLKQPLPAEEGARAARRLIEREITSPIGRLLSEKPQKKLLTFKVTATGLKIS